MTNLPDYELLYTYLSGEVKKTLQPYREKDAVPENLRGLFAAFLYCSIQADAEANDYLAAFEDNEIADAYASAPRFDEGHINQSPLYNKAYHALTVLEDKLRGELSPAGQEILQDYQNTNYEAIEYECMHFFEQGWRMGRTAEEKSE